MTTSIDDLLEMARRMEVKLDSLSAKFEAYLGDKTSGTMTDNDVNLICNSDDIIGSIDAWNRKAKERRRRSV